MAGTLPEISFSLELNNNMAATFKSGGRQRPIRVFFASPGDMPAERRAFREAIGMLNKGIGGFKFEPLGQEDMFSEVGRRPQDDINRRFIDTCDVFLLAFHRRWGQKTRDTKPPSTSYTHEEFLRALERFEKSGTPKIYVFFKTVHPECREDPGPQLKKVLKFRTSLQKTGYYIPFDDEAQFRDQFDRHLWDYAYSLDRSTGEPQPLDAPREGVELEALEHVRAQAAEFAAQADKLALALAQKAAAAAQADQQESARQLFAEAIAGTHNLEILGLAFEFHQRVGEWSVAEEMLNRSLAISGRDTMLAETASALEKLGWVYSFRGQEAQAEAMYKEALTIYEKVGRQEGVATACGNLGLIYWRKGDFVQAEKLHKKSLNIETKLGRQDHMANLCSNLGQIYSERQDQERAEAMHRKALQIYEKRGREAERASEYGHLGSILQKRGDLANAEAMHKRALAINEKLNRQEGMSIELTNLGMVYQSRGDLAQAIAFLRQSLAISEMLPWHEGMADQYDKLGLLYQASGDANNARKFWILASDSFARVGDQRKVQEIQARLSKQKGRPGGRARRQKPKKSCD